MKLVICVGRLLGSFVCVATSPRLLIEVDANHNGQKATGLHNRAAQTSYVHRHSRE
jgi:hypothetical protein